MKPLTLVALGVLLGAVVVAGLSAAPDRGNAPLATAASLLVIPLVLVGLGLMVWFVVVLFLAADDPALQREASGAAVHA